MIYARGGRDGVFRPPGWGPGRHQDGRTTPDDCETSRSYGTTTSVDGLALTLATIAREPAASTRRSSTGRSSRSTAGQRRGLDSFGVGDVRSGPLTVIGAWRHHRARRRAGLGRLGRPGPPSWPPAVKLPSTTARPPSDGKVHGQDKSSNRQGSRSFPEIAPDHRRLPRRWCGGIRTTTGRPRRTDDSGGQGFPLGTLGLLGLLVALVPLDQDRVDERRCLRTVVRARGPIS